MKRKLWLFMLCFLFLLLPADPARAASKDVYISGTNSIVFTSIKDVEYYFVYKDGIWEDFTSVVSSNEKVAYPVLYDTSADHFIIEPAGTGTCTISVTDEKNKKKNIKVTVADTYEYSRLANETIIDNCWYGTKKIYVWTLQNCTGTVKIKKDSYKFKIGSSSFKTVKLKKRYKLNEKVTVTIKRGTAKYVWKGTLKSFTVPCYIDGRNKKINVQIKNLHKGDIVQIKHRGKSYKKTIQKDADDVMKTISFKTKKKVRANGEKITVIIKNSAKKLLNKTQFTLTDHVDGIDDDDGSDSLDDE